LIRNEHNYSKVLNTYRHRFLTSLTEWRRFITLATTPSNQQNLLLTMVQVLYLLEAYILAHYGPPNTEIPKTETTIVRWHKNSWIYLTSTYYWWFLRPMITIWFDSKFQIIAQLFNSIRNEKTLFAQRYSRLGLFRSSKPHGIAAVSNQNQNQIKIYIAPYVHEDSEALGRVGMVVLPSG